MTFEDLTRRIANMRLYGMSREDIHNQIVTDESEEQTFFFAWVAACVLLNS